MPRFLRHSSSKNHQLGILISAITRELLPRATKELPTPATNNRIPRSEMQQLIPRDSSSGRARVLYVRKPRARPVGQWWKRRPWTDRTIVIAGRMQIAPAARRAEGYMDINRGENGRSFLPDIDAHTYAYAHVCARERKIFATRIFARDNAHRQLAGDLSARWFMQRDARVRRDARV